ncbi:MAG: MFS transporter [Promethearchaeota archaeon]|nr:MAG: MFS transporter [Candidatus Lokiarchaeota archaeon]
MKHQSFIILILLTLFSSALMSIIMPMAKEVAQTLKLESEAQVQIINSIFLFVGAFSSIAWAILGDKFSRKIMLIIGTFIWSFFSFLTIFATDFYSLLFFQIFAAIGFGSALPLIFSLLVDSIEAEKRGKSFGTLSAAYVLGNGLGHMLSGFLIDYFPWIVPFIIISICGIFCMIFLFFMKEPTRGEMETSSEMDDESLGLSFKIKIKDFKKIWQKKTIFWILIFNFVMFVAIGAISSNFISMLKNDYHFSSSIATLFLIIVFGSQMISGPIIGDLADKKNKTDKNGRIKYVLICIVIGSICYIIGFCLIFSSNNVIMLIIFFIFVLIGAFFFGGIDPLTQATLGDISPPQIRSTIYSLNFLAYTFGRSLSILLLAFLFIGYGNLYRPGYVILSIMALISSLFVFILLNTLPKDLDATESD